MYLVFGLSFVSRNLLRVWNHRAVQVRRDFWSAVCEPLLRAGLASARERVARDPVQLLWVHPSLEATSLDCTIQDLSITVIFFPHPFYLFETCLAAACCFASGFIPHCISEEMRKTPFSASLLVCCRPQNPAIIVVIHWPSSSFWSLCCSPWAPR